MPVVALPADIEVLVRGWLHGNVVLLRGRVPALIDTGYHTGVDVLRAQFERFVGPASTLQAVALTHVHSDHAGGVCAIRPWSSAAVHAHPDVVHRVEAWDEQLLWLGPSGQELPRFSIDATYVEGDTVELGDRRFEVVWTPGHAAGGVALFDPMDGVLVTGDALWQDGFGLLNPWVEGREVGELAGRALASLRKLDARLVIPGHGEPFTDVGEALDRADSRLAYLLANPGAMRRTALRSNAAFYALAHPDVPQATIRAATLAMARSHRRLPGDDDPRSDEALADSILAGLSARRG